MRAVFHRYVEVRRGRHTFCIQPKVEPQSYPADIVEAAVEKGAAEKVAPRKSGKRRAK